MTPRDQQIAELYRAGKGLRQIGREVNLSHVGVKKALVRLGVVTINSAHGPEPSPYIDDVPKALLEIQSVAADLARVGNPCSPAFVRSQGCRILALAETALKRLPPP